jgi:hypothetical protein
MKDSTMRHPLNNPVTEAVAETLIRTQEAIDLLNAGAKAAEQVAAAAGLTQFEAGHVGALNAEIGQVLVRHYTRLLGEHSPTRANELVLAAFDMHHASLSAIATKEREISTNRAIRTAARAGVEVIESRVVAGTLLIVAE